MSSKAPEFISGVSFAEAIQSLYVKPTRMFFNRRGKNVVWDLAFAHDRISVWPCCCTTKRRMRSCWLNSSVQPFLCPKSDVWLKTRTRI
ncbi:hypothetical protein L596_027804 [Steinernema carpocapsae]|uniref:Uncharacterized protein n=1 Tax=Steinernema carpocapsae TaxID=34508 RepID=A0A4U5LWL6_STECR|nr:hypothetical protein L596_027804 [Steinernema carpocapsae]